MATTQLSDAIVPSVYGSYASVNDPYKTALFESGIIARSQLFDAIAKGGGKVGNLPFWKDLDPTLEPNYSNDDPADLAVPNKIAAGEQVYRKAFVNQGFSAMDLVTELTGSDPMLHIKSRFNTYWQRQLQRRLVAMLSGLFADNVAANGGDMVVDISALTGDAAKISGAAAVAAEYTMGDAVGGFTGLAVHSLAAKQLALNDLIETERDSEGKVIAQRYQGKTLIIDDNMPYDGVGGTVISALLGGGSIGFGAVDGHSFALGEGVPRVPVEVERNPRAGNGGGEEVLWERKTWLLHPFGYKWIEGTLVEFSPTLTDLKDAAHWERVVSRKQVPIAFIKSKV